MSHYVKLVVFKSEDELKARAAGYPCLVNYNPFTKTGEYDDGVGHTSTVTFAVASTKDELAAIDKGQYDILEIQDPETFAGL